MINTVWVQRYPPDRLDRTVCEDGQLFGLLDAKRALEVGKQAIFDKDGHRTKLREEQSQISSVSTPDTGVIRPVLKYW